MARPNRGAGLPGVVAAVNRKASLLAGVALALASVIFALVIAEVLLRTVHPLPDPYWRYKTRPHMVATYIPSQFPPNMSLQLRTEPGLPGTNPQVRFTVNNVGLRGDPLIVPKPAEEFRVFMVGGSTTECLYLDDADALTRVVQDSLARRYPLRKIRVYGAGKSGDKSYDHVAMISHRLVHLQPDLIVVFAGINDLMAAVNGRDYLFFPSTESTNWTFPQLMRLTATELQVGRLLFGALKPRSYRTAVEEIAMTSTIRRSVSLRQSLPMSKDQPRTDVLPYEENLRTIAGTARAHGVRLAFLTQATTWASPIDPRVSEWHWLNFGGGERFSDAVMEDAIQSYNDAMKRVAANHELPVLDLAAIIPKSLDYFYDDVHFNVRGAATTGGILARFLAGQQLVTE